MAYQGPLESSSLHGAPEMRELKRCVPGSTPGRGRGCLDPSLLLTQVLWQRHPRVIFQIRPEGKEELGRLNLLLLR